MNSNGECGATSNGVSALSDGSRRFGHSRSLVSGMEIPKNTGNSKMTAFAGSEPEKAGKTAKSSEGAAADKSETDEIEKSRQMQFEARAAAEAEKEQLFLKNPKRCQMSFWFLSEDLLFRMASAAPAQLCQIPHCCRMGYCNRVCADRSSVFWNLWRFPSQCRHSCLSL